MSRTEGKHSAAKCQTTLASGPAGFTGEERAAMKERARELKAQAANADGEYALLGRIAEMSGADHTMAGSLHALVKASAPELAARTWYGMPAYARNGKVVCFFQGAQKFEARYAILGFGDAAHLDDGSMWLTAFALKEFTAAEVARVVALLRKAVG